MAVSGKIRKQQYRARKKVRRENVQKAIDAMPPEWADDCRMWIAPPGPTKERPTVEWDIGAKTNALMKAHAEDHGVTLDDLLYEAGRQFIMKRPNIYWAMKTAKVRINEN